MNLHDPCAANKKVNGKQIAAAWHPDDTKVSHVNGKAADEFVIWSKSKCEDAETGKMEANRGKAHDFLGTTFDCAKKGSSKLGMADCVKKMVKSFPVI